MRSMVPLLAVLLAAGCGGGGGGGSSASGNGGVGSQGHMVAFRMEQGDTPQNIFGHVIEGEVFVTLEPTTNVDLVHFYLDNPGMVGTPYRTEVNPPFDFNGGTTTGSTAWDTGDIPDGPHEITAELFFLDGTSEVIGSTFTIDNATPSVVTNKSAIGFQFAADEIGSATTTAQLSLSGGGTAPFTLQYQGASWLTVTQSGSTLPATLTIAVNSTNVPVGAHEVDIIASAAGYTSAQISVTLTVTPAAPPPPGTVVSFDKQLIRHDFSIDTPGTGTSSVILSATNGSTDPYTLSFTPAPWLAVAPTSGNMPGTIQVTVDSTGLAPGVYERDLSGNVAGQPPAIVTVRVSVASGSSTVATSISRHGITWFFDAEYTVGQFVNGDWYVVGPAVISSVSPSWNGTYDGAMINPVYSGDHGYDARWNFESSLRVNTNNLLLAPGESLICVDSWRDGEAGAPSSNNTLGIPRPAIKTAAVLTCLAAPPPPGSFRPPYGGEAKPLHNVSQLRRWLLPQLEKPDSTPDLADIEACFAGVWLDHNEKWENRYMHPDDHMPDYGRDLTDELNVGSLMLMLDFTEAQKETLTIRLVQIGIDMHAIIQSGANWGPDTGGHGGGRKWPVLLAGILLNDATMMDVGFDYPDTMAQEDCQTFYLTAAQAGDYPGETIGTPVWGERHCSNPSSDPGATGYRTCCTANAWVGAVLSVHILTGETNIDVKALWNHDALFDYQDLYMDEQPVGDWTRSWTEFPGDMWDMYRADYGPIYVN